MNKIEIDNYYEPESKTIRLDEADLNQIDTNTIQILLKENYKLKKENQELKEKLYLCTPEIPQNSHNNYISYVDLINKLYSIEKENDILLNVQEDAEKSLHKIRELKKELNKVNDENKRLKEIKYAKKAAGGYESNYDYLGGKKNMTEEILTEFKNMVEEFQKTERVKK